MAAPTSRLPALVTALACLLAAVRAHADGVPVGPVPGDAQCRPCVGADGRGGAIVSYKTAALQLGAVHVGANGAPDRGLAIAPSPLPFELEPSEPLRVAVPSDSQIVVVSDRAPAASPMLTRVRSGGAASAGFPVALPMPLRHSAIVPGLGGRTLLVAKDSDATYFWTIRAAIIGPTGNVEFAVQISSYLQFFNADPIVACSDGAGGLIAAMPYYDPNLGSKDLAVWKLDAHGNRPWGERIVPFIFAHGDQVEVQIAPDGSGGALLVWTDPRIVTLSNDIYAMHIRADGGHDPLWQYYGNPVCEAHGAQGKPQVAPDGTGGLWVLWQDLRNELAGDLRYTHVLGDGTLASGFDLDGTILCNAAGAQADAVIAGDGAGGCFAAWRDERSGTADIYAQHVLAGGGVAAGWSANGRAMTTAPGAQDQPAIASVAGGRAVVAWRDARDGTTRIYSAGIEDASTTAAPPVAPAGLRLGSHGVCRGVATLDVTLPAGAAGVLELLDLSGRVRAHQELAGPLAGRSVTLAPAIALSPGLYFARLRQGGAAAVARFTLLR